MGQEPVSFGIVSPPGPSKLGQGSESALGHLLILIYRAYYARPLSATSTSKDRLDRRLSTSTENISLNMFRPRTRAKDADDHRRRSSLAIGRVRPGESDLGGVRGHPQHRLSPTWSPHLWRNTASHSRRRTIFQAPSLDEQAEGNALSKRTAQILLFAVGFVFAPGDSHLCRRELCRLLIFSESMVHSSLPTATSKAGGHQRKRKGCTSPDRDARRS